MTNYFEMKIKAISENESFVRNLVASFALNMNPTIDQITDIKTAVSEAVTNCIVHAYRGCNENKYFSVTGSIDGDKLEIIIRDDGVGISNVEEAVAPFFTTCEGEERSGMGFTLMETFMDEMHVESAPNSGTTVRLIKYIESEKEICDVGA